MASLYKNGSIWYVRYKDTDGTWKGVSTRYKDKPSAQRFMAEWVRGIEAEAVLQGKASLRDMPASGGALTVARYYLGWIERRKAKGLACARNDESRMRHHILPLLGSKRLDEVRRRDICALIDSVTGKLAPRTVHFVHASVTALFESALVEDLIPANPCRIRGVLPKLRDKDPFWRLGAVFAREEVELLISDIGIPAHERAMYAILFLTGIRFGELAALRWKVVDLNPQPLGRISIAVAYSLTLKRIKWVKTEVPRPVPIHPALAPILRRWYEGGWAEYTGRGAPSSEDLVVPGDDNGCLISSRSLKRFHKHLDRLGLRRRRQHDTRRTFATLAETDGAKRHIVKEIIKGPASDAYGIYVTTPFHILCEEISKLQIRRIDRAPPNNNLDGPSTGTIGVATELALLSSQWAETPGADMLLAKHGQIVATDSPDHSRPAFRGLVDLESGQERTGADNWRSNVANLVRAALTALRQSDQGSAADSLTQAEVFLSQSRRGPAKARPPAWVPVQVALSQEALSELRELSAASHIPIADLIRGAVEHLLRHDSGPASAAVRVVERWRESIHSTPKRKASK